MDPLAIIADWPGMAMPPELFWLLVSGCALLAASSLGLMVRRTMTVQRAEVTEAASLFAVREIAACLHAEGPVDVDLLRDTIAAAPRAAVLQFLRLHRGEHQALVQEQAELAGTFGQALEALESGIATREIDALKQLQLARGPRFRAAVRKKVMRAATVQVRCEALYTFIAMGSDPSPLALADWIDHTGPDLTPRHRALFHLIAERLPGSLPQLIPAVGTPPFREALDAHLAERRAAEAMYPEETAGDGPRFAHKAA